MWDLWWTKWRWGRFSPSTAVSPANLYSTTFSTITRTYLPGLVQLTSSGLSTQSPTPLIKKKSIFVMRFVVCIMTDTGWFQVGLMSHVDWEID
jgi:hypothetical protein